MKALDLVKIRSEARKYGQEYVTVKLVVPLEKLEGCLDLLNMYGEVTVLIEDSGYIETIVC